VQAFPKGLCAGFTITISTQEPADPGDHADHLVQGRVSRRPEFVEQIGAPYAVWIKEQWGFKIRTGAANTHQVGDTSGHYLIQNQRTIDAFNGTHRAISPKPVNFQ
jgi:hypothetical protein